MPVEALEATLKAITLMEDFTDFDSQLPDAKYFCFSLSPRFTRSHSKQKDIHPILHLG